MNELMEEDRHGGRKVRGGGWMDDDVDDQRSKDQKVFVCHF